MMKEQCFPLLKNQKKKLNFSQNSVMIISNENTKDYKFVERFKQQIIEFATKNYMV